MECFESKTSKIAAQEVEECHAEVGTARNLGSWIETDDIDMDKMLKMIYSFVFMVAKHTQLDSFS